MNDTRYDMVFAKTIVIDKETKEKYDKAKAGGCLEKGFERISEELYKRVHLRTVDFSDMIAKFYLYSHDGCSVGGMVYWNMALNDYCVGVSCESEGDVLNHVYEYEHRSGEKKYLYRLRVIDEETYNTLKANNDESIKDVEVEMDNKEENKEKTTVREMFSLFTDKKDFLLMDLICLAVILVACIICMCSGLGGVSWILIVPLAYEIAFPRFMMDKYLPFKDTTDGEKDKTDEEWNEIKDEWKRLNAMKDAVEKMSSQLKKANDMLERELTDIKEQRKRLFDDWGSISQSWKEILEERDKIRQEREKKD